MLITNTTRADITLNFYDGTRFTVPGLGSVSRPDANQTLLDDDAVVVGYFTAGTLVATTDGGSPISIGPGVIPPPKAGVAAVVTASRALTSADDGLILECTTTLTLTVPAGLPTGFACSVMASGTTSIASGGGTLLNGATTTVTRAAASNSIFAIVAKSTAVNSYVVTGS